MGDDDTRGPDAADATRARLELERDRVTAERRELATRLGGEDPEDPDIGDSADAAGGIEGSDDLARMDRRITDLDHRLATLGSTHETTRLADGTDVTLRFSTGEVVTLRVVDLVEELPASEQDRVLTSDSPLGKALVGRNVGDTVVYETPSGEARVTVLGLRGPGS
jgi:transcription elongation factor GreA